MMWPPVCERVSARTRTEHLYTRRTLWHFVSLNLFNHARGPKSGSVNDPFCIDVEVKVDVLLHLLKGLLVVRDASRVDVPGDVHDDVDAFPVLIHEVQSVLPVARVRNVQTRQDDVLWASPLVFELSVEGLDVDIGGQNMVTGPGELRNQGAGDATAAPSD